MNISSSLDKVNHISIGFVIYLPEKSFVEKIKAITESGYTVYIYDNSPSIDFVREFCKSISNCKYLTCGKNVGLGYGISSVCGQAYFEGSEALLFFDQDTNFTLETLDYVSNFFVEYKDCFKPYAAIQFSNNLRSSEFLNLNYTIDKKRLLISSGSLFSLKNMKEINWHNTNYFVDGVDYEFCLRAHSKGYLLGEITTTPGFDHVTGQADEEYIFFKKRLFLRKYKTNRITDILISYNKLFFNSLLRFEWRYSLIFVKSFFLFFIFQLLHRLLNFYKVNLKHGK